MNTLAASLSAPPPTTRGRRTRRRRACSRPSTIWRGWQDGCAQDRLIDSPLLVTIVAIVHYNERRLPEQRAELYEKCVEVP
ncbi:MAG: hypothetical protein R3A10_02775 [Caldilineaceae bacterium]